MIFRTGGLKSTVLKVWNGHETLFEGSAGTMAASTTAKAEIAIQRSEQGILVEDQSTDAHENRLLRTKVEVLQTVEDERD